MIGFFRTSRVKAITPSSMGKGDNSPPGVAVRLGQEAESLTRVLTVKTNEAVLRPSLLHC